MSKTEAQQRARLMWDAACERLAKALHPSPGTPGEPPVDLAEALLVAQLSLDAVRAAFEVDVRSEQQAQNQLQQQQRRSRERS
jgi:hypothetical protein